MLRAGRLTACIVAIVALGPSRSAFAAAQARSAARSDVTFNRDVAPLLFARCVTCHRPDGPAPFSLATYSDARRRAGLMASVTRSRYMPPWKPEPGFGDFVGDRRLTDAQIEILDRWARIGTPEGDAADRPPLPHFAPGWQNGSPDLVVALPHYTLRPDGLDVFRNFVASIPGTGTRYVRGLELRPGSSAVHHANIRLDYTAASRQLDEADPEPGYEGLILHTADYPDGHFLGWTPGQFSPLAPGGLAWRLNPGADLVVQLHMRPTGKPETIAPVIGLYFTDDPPVRLPAMIRLGRQNIDIPAGEARYRSTDSYTLPVDAQVQAVQPHSHYRAQQVTAEARLPDGTSRPIIAIKRWDFAWQDVYRVAVPYWLPAGTRITSEYVFDNSAANPRNPVRPPARARWGFRSSDEMADVWIQVLTRSDVDRERLISDFSPKMIAEDVVGAEMQLAVAPDNIPLHNDAAVLYLKLGKAKDAASHFARVVAQAPQSAVAHYNLGTALEQSGNPAEAARQYERAVALDPDYAAARTNLGNMRLQQGRVAEAIAEYNAALTRAPDDFGAHNNLGRVLLNQGRVDEAAAHIDAALRLNPENPESHFNRAELLVLTGRLTDAAEHYRDALRLRPHWEPSLIGLSWLLSSSADASVRAPAEALQLATEAATLSARGNPLALDALAAACARLGRFDEAVATAADAMALASRANARELTAAIGARLALYRNHQAYTAR